MARACWRLSARTTGAVVIVAPHVARLPGWTTDIVSPSRTHPVRTTARIGVVAGHIARLSGWTADTVRAVRTRPLRTADRVRGVVTLERDRERSRPVRT